LRNDLFKDKSIGAYMENEIMQGFSHSFFAFGEKDKLAVEMPFSKD
jgi:hypothetical protein